MKNIWVCPLIPLGWSFWLEEHVNYDLLLLMMSMSVQILPLSQARSFQPIRCSSTFVRSNEGIELNVCTAPFTEFVHDQGFFNWPPVNGFSGMPQWWLLCCMFSILVGCLLPESCNLLPRGGNMEKFCRDTVV